MILYKAIKYSILDYCLNSICDNILKNFNKFSNGAQTVTVEDLVPGMYIKRMEFEEYGFWWTNVTILSVGAVAEQGYDPEYEPDYNLYFSFSETNFDRKTTDEQGKELLSLESIEPVKIEI